MDVNMYNIYIYTIQSDKLLSGLKLYSTKNNANEICAII